MPIQETPQSQQLADALSQNNADLNTKPPTEPATQQSADEFARKFAALTRKERELLDKQKSYESDYQKKLQELTEKQSKYKKYEDLEGELSTNKRKLLEFAQSQGVTLDDLSNMLIEELNPNEDVKVQRRLSETEKRLEEKLARLEKSIEERSLREKQEQEELAKSQHDKVVQGVLKDLTDFINKGDYPLIQSQQQVQLVYDVIQEDYQKQLDEGRPPQLINILSYKDAAEKVEQHLDAELEKMYSVKKSKLKPESPADPLSELKKESTPTLTNANSAADASKVTSSLSREDVIKEAMKMIRFT